MVVDVQTQNFRWPMPGSLTLTFGPLLLSIATSVWKLPLTSLLPITFKMHISKYMKLAVMFGYHIRLFRIGPHQGCPVLLLPKHASITFLASR